MKVLFLSALPEILAGIRLGAIRGVKGVVIGQILISIIGEAASDPLRLTRQFRQ